MLEDKFPFYDMMLDDNLKQKYLDELLKYCPESVERIVYDPKYIEINRYLDQLIETGY